MSIVMEDALGNTDCNCPDVEEEEIIQSKDVLIHRVCHGIIKDSSKVFKEKKRKKK